MKLQSCKSEILITAGFYEPFTAANAIQALNQVGFKDGDIGMVGMLDGPVTDLTGICEAIGMPLAHALYYQSSFEDGGVLLIVRARELSMRELLWPCSMSRVEFFRRRFTERPSLAPT